MCVVKFFLLLSSGALFRQVHLGLCVSPTALNPFEYGRMSAYTRVSLSLEAYTVWGYSMIALPARSAQNQPSLPEASRCSSDQ
ncbi:hypothetical protein HOY82DRAFT_554602 [Tuber indicum]|nr:hypothetical protein HOY82DRAFT_554602 [Tuber indicum]